jgi:hypothetical protein
VSAEPVAQEADLHFTVYDNNAAKTYELNETINSSGIYLEFKPSLSVCNLCHTKEDYIEEWYLTENHALGIPVFGNEYALSCLEFDGITNKSKLCLAEEESRVILNPYSCMEEDVINASGKRFGFIDFGWIQGEEKTIICEILDNGTCTNESYIRIGESWQIPDDGILHLWLVAPGYTFCAKWIDMSYFSNEIVLEDRVNGMVLDWENETAWNPSLKSVFIPANGSAYEKLTK